MIYITGDTHGNFLRLQAFCQLHKLTYDDIIIILGDSGINYYNNISQSLIDDMKKITATLFCIHGNHEYRAENLDYYHPEFFAQNTVYVTDYFPHVKFAVDGEVYYFDSNGEQLKTLVVGGAYSVDKYYRLNNGLAWHHDEQPNDAIKAKTEAVIENENNQFDYILTHTCPNKFRPIEWFMPMIHQESVDNTTELWLDTIHDRVSYKKWYCGHFHGNKFIKDENICFLFDCIAEFGKDTYIE